MGFIMSRSMFEVKLKKTYKTLGKTHNSQFGTCSANPPRGAKNTQASRASPGGLLGPSWGLFAPSSPHGAVMSHFGAPRWHVCSILEPFCIILDPICIDFGLAGHTQNMAFRLQFSSVGWARNSEFTNTRWNKTGD